MSAMLNSRFLIGDLHIGNLSVWGLLVDELLACRLLSIHY